MAKDEQHENHMANVMVYISPCTNKFYNIESCAVHENFKIYDCLPRTPPPGKLNKLQFTCILANNQKMRF